MTAEAVSRSVRPAAGDQAPARRGRPRDERLDAALVETTLRLLADRGYTALSLAAVAAASGVGRPALYRRFPSKADLVAAALEAIATRPEPALPDDTREALGALLATTADALTGPGGLTMLGSLLAHAASEPELLAAFRRRVIEPRHAVVDAVLRAGVARGEVDPDADRQAVSAMLVGGLFARAIEGRPLDGAWCQRLLDVAWRSIARR